MAFLLVNHKVIVGLVDGVIGQMTVTVVDVPLTDLLKSLGGKPDDTLIVNKHP